LHQTPSSAYSEYALGRSLAQSTANLKVFATFLSFFLSFFLSYYSKTFYTYLTLDFYYSYKEKR